MKRARLSLVALGFAFLSPSQKRSLRNGLQETSTGSTIPFLKNYCAVGRSTYCSRLRVLAAHYSQCRGRNYLINMSRLLERGASITEMNDMFELMDVDSEQIVACPASETTREVDITSDLTHTDSNAYKAGLHEKPSFGSGAWEKPPTSIWNSVRLETRRNPPCRVSRVRYDQQKRKVSFPGWQYCILKRNSQIRRRPPKASHNLHELARVMMLSQRLVGHDPMDLFTQNCVKVITDWISLLGKTTVPGDLVSSDPCIISAFKAVDRIICGKEGTHLLRRLAYVRLMRIFATLESIIKSERENGRAPREPCYRDATIAIDIYMKAQEDRSHPDALRRELKERKRAGRSWSDLAGPSPLFTMIYSDAAESIVYGITRPRKICY